LSQTFETQFGGRTLTIETGKLARLAGGSVTVRYGDTMVLGTANRSEPRPGLDFFPLTVDFEERMYAAGKIPGGFIKREARPSENAHGRPIARSARSSPRATRTTCSS
jgi:polyribonucleotide nucleotidyltransferase